MNINQHNCEAYFLDYYEGTLSEAQVAEMFAFLKANPDLREVFESFSDVSVDFDILNTPDFSFLKKDSVVDVHELAEQWMVDSVDGTITEENRISLENYLSEYPEKRNDLVAFEKTILRADEKETFDSIGFLKKETAITADNFEDYAIALVEGTISEKENSLLEAFVTAHPEFRFQLDGFRASKLKTDESIVFDAKSSLKKTSVAVTNENIAELLVEKSEGQLAAHEEQAVDAFVAQHPEYRADIELLAKTKLVADPSEVFDAKSALKKGAVLINEENFEQYLISASEGLLNGEELKIFNAFVATQPKYGKAVAQYAATRLQPDMSIVYDDKEGLKRKEKGGAIWWSVNIRYAAAAVVVIVLGIYFWMKFNSGNPDEASFANIKQQQNNDEVVPFLEDDNVKINPDQTDLYANADTENDTPEIKQPKDGGRNEHYANTNDVHGRPTGIIEQTYTPVTILAGQLSVRKPNDAVDFSDALYGVVYNKTEPDPAAPAKEYISPGQFAMRWMKDKLEGTDPEPVFAQEEGDPNVHALNENVDGLDLTQTAVNRVGQSTANGNISMDQRKDGTYLHLWNYEVRVAK